MKGQICILNSSFKLLSGNHDDTYRISRWKLMRNWNRWPLLPPVKIKNIRTGIGREDKEFNTGTNDLELVTFTQMKMSIRQWTCLKIRTKFLAKGKDLGTDYI